MEYFLNALKQYADFNGRATRQQYWMYYLFYLIFTIAVGIVDRVLGTLVLSAIYTLVLLIPSISICTRRLHDTGRSG